ncbi:MAG: phosphotransferase [Bacteroidales bacterium]|nr:phosphotransferase [Bacteroidales bacterium]
MEATRISLKDYVLTGGGANGESYDNKHDPSIMLKLYFPGKIQQPLDEMMLARKVYDIGIPTPEPGDYVVTEDGRYGIRFKRIPGKKSYSRATADEPDKVDQFASEFARMCRQLHATHVDTSLFDNVKDRNLRLLEESPFFTATEKERLGRFITDTPDEDTAVHGDLQFSNAIFAGDKRYFIDLGDFCYGNHLFDIAMVFLCCTITPEPFIREAFHMTKSLSTKFWEFFAPEYFGTGIPLKEIEEQIRPYAGLKTLIIERDTGQPMPVFREALKSIL